MKETTLIKVRWGLRCNSCSQDSPCWFSCGYDALLEAIVYWPELRGVEILRTRLTWWDLSCDPLSNTSAEHPTVFQFLGEHHEHDLVFLNEHGQTKVIPTGAAARAKMRPPNYNSLPTAEQWAIDKRLGILDWDGKPA